LLYLAILVTLVILSSFVVVHSYAQVSEGKHFLRVTSSLNTIYLPGGGFYDAGTSVTLEAPEVWRDYKFEGWEIDGRLSFDNPVTLVMNRDHNVEAIYTKTGSVGEIIIDAIPQITGITVDNTIYLPSELPLSFNWEDGSVHSIIISDVVNETPDTRYKFDSWKDRNHQTIRTITIDQDTRNIIALYKTQYYIKPITELGIILGGGWHDKGSTASFELELDVITDKQDEYVRHVFDSWDNGDYQNSPSNTINVVEPITVKAKWREQYKLDLKSNIPDYNLLGSDWYEQGRKVALIAEETLESLNSDTEYVFYRWVSKGSNPVIIPNAHLPATTIEMNEPYVLEAQFKRAYLINVWTPFGTAVGGGYYPEGEIAEIGISNTQVVVDPNKVRMIFSGWNSHGARTMEFSASDSIENTKSEFLPAGQNLMVFVDAPVNVTANWKQQYYLNLQSEKSDVQGGGWYDIGRMATISVKAPSTPPGLWTAHVFDKWVGDFESDSKRERVIMNKPKTVIAEWKEDNTPGIFNSIILAGVATIGVAIYAKTHKKIPAFSSKKNKKSYESVPFERYFDTKNNLGPQQNSSTVTKPSKGQAVLKWLLGRD